MALFYQSVYTCTCRSIYSLDRRPVHAVIDEFISWLVFIDLDVYHDAQSHEDFLTRLPTRF